MGDETITSLNKLRWMLEVNDGETSNEILSKYARSKKASIAGFQLLFLYEADPHNEALVERERKLRKRLGKEFIRLVEKAKQRWNVLQEAKSHAILVDERLTMSRKVILSLDGGGIRGLVSIATLIFLSKFLFGDEHLAEIFDWAVGTSVGSIIATGLIKGKTLSELQKKFFELKGEIFPSLISSTARSHKLQSFLSQEFGSPTDCFTLREEERDRDRKFLTIVAVDKTLRNNLTTYVFRNYGLAVSQHNFKRSNHTYVEAIMCSAAAPWYFKSHHLTVDANSPNQPARELKMVDGGLLENCPLRITLQELQNFKNHCEKVRIGLLLSIGTGSPSQQLREGIRDSIPVVNLFNLFLEACTNTNDIVQQAESYLYGKNVHFSRFSPQDINVGLAENDDKKLIDMMWKTQTDLLTEENRIKIQELRRALRRLYQYAQVEISRL